MRVRRCTTGTRRTPQFSTTVEFHGFADVTPDGLYARHHLPQYFVRVHDMAPAPVLGEPGSKRYYDVWHALGIHTAEPVAEMLAFHPRLWRMYFTKLEESALDLVQTLLGSSDVSWVKHANGQEHH